MKDTAKRKDVLNAARTLVGRYGNAFTISNLCEESGISRSALRRVFPTKTKLLEALAQDAIQNARPGLTRTRPSANSDDWFDRRFRVLERAIASLEVRIEKDVHSDRGVEQPSPATAGISRSVDFTRTFRSTSAQNDHQPTQPLPLSNGIADQGHTQEATVPLPSSIASEITTDNSAIFQSSPGIENCPPPSPFEDASEPLSPSCEMQSSGLSELPPIVGSDIASTGHDSAGLISPDGDVEGLDLGAMPHRPAVEPEVMRAILINARAQVSAAADIQTDQRLSNTNGQKLTIVAATAIVAVGLIVGGVTSYLHFYKVSKAPPERVSAHSSAPRASTSGLLIINATGEGEPLQEQPPAWIKSITSRAAKGDTNSQSKLALAYLKGDGVTADPAAALGWSQMAAAQGDPSAQFLLGTIYAGGIKPNPAIAVRWFAAAAHKGNLKAMHNLAIAYLNGTGVSKDFGAALSWLGKAASLWIYGLCV